MGRQWLYTYPSVWLLSNLRLGQVTAAQIQLAQFTGIGLIDAAQVLSILGKGAQKTVANRELHVIVLDKVDQRHSSIGILSSNVEPYQRPATLLTAVQCKLGHIYAVVMMSKHCGAVGSTTADAKVSREKKLYYN